MSMRTGRRPRPPRGNRAHLPEALRAAAACVKEAFDVRIDPELLGVSEQTELIALTTKIRHVERSKLPPRAPAAEVEAFTSKTLKLKEEYAHGGPGLMAKADLLIARARSSGRLPSAEDREVIFASKDPDASLGSLGLTNPGSRVVARGIRLNVLDVKERARLEELIEMAAGVELGQIFAKRKEQQRLRTQLAELAAMVAPGPRRRKRVDEPGVVVLPPGVWEDILRSDGDGVWLQAGDLTTLNTVLFALETRRLPPHAAAAGIVRLEDDDNTLVVRKRAGAPWGALADQGDEIGALFAPSLKRLVHCRWLALAEANGVSRISRGARMLEFLQQREEVA